MLTNERAIKDTKTALQSRPYLKSRTRFGLSLLAALCSVFLVQTATYADDSDGDDGGGDGSSGQQQVYVDDGCSRDPRCEFEAAAGNITTVYSAGPEVDVESGTPDDPSTPGPTGLNPDEHTCNPVIIASDSKYIQERDFSTQSEAPIGLTRTYNAAGPVGMNGTASPTGIFGFGWASTYELSLKINADGSITAWGGDGGAKTYTMQPDGRYENGSPDADDWFIPNGSAYQRQSQEGAIQNYNSLGQVTSVIGPTGLGWSATYTGFPIGSKTYQFLTKVTFTNGQTIQFGYTYNGSWKVTSVTDPAGNVYNYSYNSNGILSSVTTPSSPSHTRTYSYSTITKQGHPYYFLSGLAIDGVSYGV